MQGPFRIRSIGPREGVCYIIEICCPRQILIVLSIQGLTLYGYRTSQSAKYFRTFIPHSSSLLEIRDRICIFPSIENNPQTIQSVLLFRTFDTMAIRKRLKTILFKLLYKNEVYLIQKLKLTSWNVASLSYSITLNAAQINFTSNSFSMALMKFSPGTSSRR